MIEVLHTIFETVDVCKEEGHACKTHKDAKGIFKPDAGICKTLENDLFGGITPKLCDCVVVCQNNKCNLVEIKCGKVTQSLLKDVHEKLTNTNKIINHKMIDANKNILIYKSFKDPQIRKLINSKKYFVCGRPIIHKQYQNQAIEVCS